VNTKKAVYYTYDDLHRLTRASTTLAATGGNYNHSFSYDAVGNLQTHAGISYVYDGSSGANYANPHAPTTVGASAYTYDKAGNLLTDGFLTNTWDYRDRLVQTVAVGSTTATSTYTYDHDGNRVSKTAAGLTTFYPNRYYTITAAGDKNKYVYVNGQIFADIATVGTTTAIRYVFPDYLGSTNAVTSDSGVVENLTDYYPFGSTRLNQASGFDEQRKYVGQFYDASADLNYLNARYYDGGRGQFLSQDPVFWELGQSQEGKIALLDPQLQNSYSYARNNPTTYKDPGGRFVPLLLSAAYLALTIYDAYDTANTIANPNASFGEKVFAGGLFLSPIGEFRAGAVGLSKADNMLRNAAAGALREVRFAEELAKQFPGSSIQKEVYLRNADGSIAKDPLTGQARRIDYVVIEDGKIRGLHEVTSQTANKRAQLFKEESIRQNGGTYIRDRQTGKLIDVSNMSTRLNRRD
jgi:RHS repeat-associated protein